TRSLGAPSSQARTAAGVISTQPFLTASVRLLAVQCDCLSPRSKPTITFPAAVHPESSSLSLFTPVILLAPFECVLMQSVSCLRRWPAFSSHLGEGEGRVLPRRIPCHPRRSEVVLLS